MADVAMSEQSEGAGPPKQSQQGAPCIHGKPTMSVWPVEFSKNTKSLGWCKRLALSSAVITVLDSSDLVS